MDDRAVDRFVRSALDARPLNAGPHPDPDALFSYFARELSQAEAEVVQAHLANCRECALVVADFAAFPSLDAPSEDDVPSDAETAAAWAELESRLGREPVGADVAALAERERKRPDVLPFAPAAPRPVVRSVWRQGSVQAFASVAALTILALSTLLVTRERFWETPDPYPVFVDLGDSEVRGAIGDPDQTRGDGRLTHEPKHIPSASRTAILSLAGLEKDVRYRVEARLAPAGHVAWFVNDAKMQSNEGLLLISLPVSRLPPGRYSLSVYAPSQPEPLKTYEFEIVRDP